MAAATPAATAQPPDMELLLLWVGRQMTTASPMALSMSPPDSRPTGKIRMPEPLVAAELSTDIPSGTVLQGRPRNRATYSKTENPALSTCVPSSYQVRTDVSATASVTLPPYFINASARCLIMEKSSVTVPAGLFSASLLSSGSKNFSTYPLNRSFISSIG